MAEVEIGGIRIIDPTPTQVDLISARDRFVDWWCKEYGKVRNDLTIDEVLQIRADPRWKTGSHAE